MDETTNKNSLFRWHRQTKPIVQSRSHRVKTSDDIQDWIKKVEEASNNATDAAFGVAPSGKLKGKAAVQLLVSEAHEQNQAYYEAQELLTQWVNEKIRFNDDDGFDDLDAWKQARQRKYYKYNSNTCSSDNKNYNVSEVERLSNLALEDDFEIDEAAIYEKVKQKAFGDKDPYANLYEMEESDAVDTVLQNMLSKEIVKKTFKKNLIKDDRLAKPNPLTRMELRQKMVKENREKRQKEEEKRRVEAQMKKEARLKAQQIILQEQKERETRARHENKLLKKEMAKIRKDMYEQRRRKEEEIKKDHDNKELLNILAGEEFERQREAEEKEMIESQRLQNDKKKKQMIKTEMVKAKIVSKNIQCLHRHLTAWYDLVLSRRLLIGKIKAMSDWKLMLKVWGAWRSHVRSRRIEAETETHERNIIAAERKKLAAEKHYTVSTLRRCFIAWQLFVNQSVETREMEREKERTKNKMLSLLNAVVEGKMGKKDEEKMERAKRGRSPAANGQVTSARTLRHSTDSENLEKLFQQPVRKAWVDDENYQSSHSEQPVSEIDGANHLIRPSMSAGDRSIGRSFPTQAWQVNRKHLKLTEKDLTILIGHGSSDQQQCKHTDKEIRRRFGTQPWMNRHFVANNFEHRYTAQQQALKEQQKQIREQKQLIEELQFEQRRQAFRQQLLQGFNTPPQTTLEEIEVPPSGHEIARGKEVCEEGTGSITSNASECRNSTVMAKPARLGGKDQLDRTGPETNEANLAKTAVTSGPQLMTNNQNEKYQKFLKKMKEREEERLRLKLEREERRWKLEEERLAQQKQEVEEKRKEMEAEKRAKAEAYRLKKQQEKLKEEERKKQLAVEEEMKKKADEHYIRSIMKYRGLLPFKKLISLSKRNWMKAVKHRERRVLRQCLRSLKQFAEKEASWKNSMADKMHQFLLIKHSFQKWRKYKFHQQFLEQRADRYCRENLRAKIFKALTNGVAVEKEESLGKMEKAATHYLSYLVRKTFLAWRYLPEWLRREEERQKRKLELRQKVTELIPDFVPHESVKVEDSEDLS